MGGGGLVSIGGKYIPIVSIVSSSLSVTSHFTALHMLFTGVGPPSHCTLSRCSLLHVASCQTGLLGLVQITSISG